MSKKLKYPCEESGWCNPDKCTNKEKFPSKECAKIIKNELYRTSDKTFLLESMLKELKMKGYYNEFLYF